MNEQVRKVLIGAVLAISGALVTYGLDAVVPILKDHGTWGPAIAAAVAILLNAVRKWIDSSKQKEGSENG